MNRIKIPDAVRTTLAVNPKVYKSIKKYCTENDISVAHFMRCALLESLAQKGIAKK